MRFGIRVLPVLAAAVVLLLSSACSQQPQAVEAKGNESASNAALSIKGAPEAVAKTVMEQLGSGTLAGFTTEKEKGQTLYEAEMKINGRSKNLLIDASGAIKEVELETTLSELAPAVQSEVQKSVGKSKILSMESLTKGGKLAGFELQIKDAKGKESGLKLNAAGKPEGKDDGEDEDDDEDEDGK